MPDAVRQQRLLALFAGGSADELNNNDLIREDMKRRAADWLERALLAGLNSGPGRPLDLDAIRARGRQIAGINPAPEA